MTSVFCVLLDSCLGTHADIRSSSNYKFNIPNPPLCHKRIKKKGSDASFWGCWLLTFYEKWRVLPGLRPHLTL